MAGAVHLQTEVDQIGQRRGDWCVPDNRRPRGRVDGEFRRGDVGAVVVSAVVAVLNRERRIRGRKLNLTREREVRWDNRVNFDERTAVRPRGEHRSTVALDRLGAAIHRPLGRVPRITVRTSERVREVGGNRGRLVE